MFQYYCCDQGGTEELLYNNFSSILKFILLIALGLLIAAMVFILFRALYFWKKRKNFATEAVKWLTKGNVIRSELEKRAGNPKSTNETNFYGNVTGSSIETVGGSVNTSITISEASDLKNIENALSEAESSGLISISDIKDVSKRVLSALLVKGVA